MGIINSYSYDDYILNMFYHPEALQKRNFYLIDELQFEDKYIEIDSFILDNEHLCRF